MADSKHPAPTATPDEVADRRKVAETEWGTYVALCPIGHNGALAYNAGDPVPVSNVERHGYLEQGLVGKVGNKEAQDVIRGIHEAAGAAPIGALPPVSLGVPVKN